MRNYHNIESTKSPFGDYRIGYSKSGVVFKITDQKGYWQAEIASNVASNHGKPYKRFCLDTLREISLALENY